MEQPTIIEADRLQKLPLVSNAKNMYQQESWLGDQPFLSCVKVKHSQFPKS